MRRRPSGSSLGTAIVTASHRETAVKSGSGECVSPPRGPSPQLFSSGKELARGKNEPVEKWRTGAHAFCLSQALCDEGWLQVRPAVGTLIANFSSGDGGAAAGTGGEGRSDLDSHVGCRRVSTDS